MFGSSQQGGRRADQGPRGGNQQRQDQSSAELDHQFGNGIVQTARAHLSGHSEFGVAPVPPFGIQSPDEHRQHGQQAESQ